MLRKLLIAILLILTLTVPALAQDVPQLSEESFAPEDLIPSGWLPERYVKLIIRAPTMIYVKFTDGSHAIITEQYGAFDLIGPLTTCKAHNIPVKLWDNNGGAITMVQIGSD